MRKTNVYHDQILGQAAAYGLKLDGLRKEYKLPFVIKLFKYLKKETKKGSRSIDIIRPKNNFDWKKDDDKYLEELENAGFKLKKWDENFIDEDTGEVVSIPRDAFEPLK